MQNALEIVMLREAVAELEEKGWWSERLLSFAGYTFDDRPINILKKLLARLEKK